MNNRLQQMENEKLTYKAKFEQLQKEVKTAEAAKLKQKGQGTES